MSDPKNPKYEGTLRFDDDNIVEVGLEPDTENISVMLNGSEITGGDQIIFNVTYDAVEQKYVSDLSLEQIVAYISAGKTLIAVINEHGFTAHYYFAAYDENASSEDIAVSFFGYSIHPDSKPYINVMSFYNSGDVTFTAYALSSNT